MNSDCNDSLWNELCARWGGKNDAARDARMFELMMKSEIGIPVSVSERRVEVTFQELTETEAIEYLYLKGFTKAFFESWIDRFQKCISLAQAHPESSALH